MSRHESVVLVHGLWMKGPDMALLRQRLRQAGYRVYQFSYRSIACDSDENARRLNAFMSRVEGTTIHFVAHSLGGLVVRRLFHDFPEQRPGRIVTLGTPHCGSYVADRLAAGALSRRLLGRSLSVLTGQLSPWRGERELGSIAGTLPVGAGMLFRKMPRPNDGTVTVDSTRLLKMSDHVTVKTSHMGLLFSRKVSQQVIAFLSRGRFDHDNNE